MTVRKLDFHVDVVEVKIIKAALVVTNQSARK